METENLKGKLCAFAVPKPDGAPFWQDGIFEGENPSHYFFNIKGRTTAVLRSLVMRIEVKGPAPAAPTAQERRS